MSLKDDKQQNIQTKLDWPVLLQVILDADDGHPVAPYTDPYVRWCGRGRRVTAAPMPITGLDGLVDHLHLARTLPLKHRQER
jgi:hypothetical protein